MAQNLKIILLGESGVGKSCIIARLKSGVFKEQVVTTCVDFHTKKVQINHTEVILNIHDTAGQERFHSMVSNYYRGADGVLLVYDVTDVSSFHKVFSWLQELRGTNEEAEVILTGNKNEDPSKKIVAINMVKSFAKVEKLEYMEISAKSGENVDLVFARLAEKILKKKGISTSKPAQNETIKLREAQPQSSGFFGFSCCS